MYLAGRLRQPKRWRPICAPSISDLISVDTSCGFERLQMVLKRTMNKNTGKEYRNFFTQVRTKLSDQKRRLNRHRHRHRRQELLNDISMPEPIVHVPFDTCISLRTDSILNLMDLSEGSRPRFYDPNWVRTATQSEEHPTHRRERERERDNK